VIGGFVAPTIIGYLSNLTGDLRGGLGGIAVLAMLMTTVFYVAGRRLSGADKRGTSLGTVQEQA
jgi:dipeptide/tripeptide permease